MSQCGAETISHSGPIISIEIRRGSEQLPISKVDHLHRGDRVLVSADIGGVAEGSWLMVLAAVSAEGTPISLQRFDLSAKDVAPSIDITDDNQIPIFVIAPQVKTFFGLGTSFNQSADLIAEAIATDTQRFIDLQKIDQLDSAITTLASGLESIVVKLKPADAIEATKTMAAKFGAKTIDPECLKGGAVDTRCVATSIVSNQNLKIPSLVELGSMAQPFATSALSTVMLANVRLVAATSEFLANKYRDQYDFAPVSAQQDKDSGWLRLITNSSFKGGDIKTAYVYVPSWYSGDKPKLGMASKAMSCLAGGKLALNVAGQLPMKNYWHSWNLTLFRPASTDAVMSLKALTFNPEKGTIHIDPKRDNLDWGQHGSLLSATLTGKYAFDSLELPSFPVALPSNEDLKSKLNGLETLVAGDKATLSFADESVTACIMGLSLMQDKLVIVATMTNNSHHELELDLKETSPGAAELEITQIGGKSQKFPVRVLKRRAHLNQLEHFDLEPILYASGENLDRIQSIQLGSDTCTPSSDGPSSLSAGKLDFLCPERLASNAAFVMPVTVNYQDGEPEPETARVKLAGPRPLVTIGSGKKSLLSVLSHNAYMWGLDFNDPLVTKDSGLSVQLVPLPGHTLAHGNYVLQLKYVDDPVTERTPISAYLMADYAHNELRTRRPVDFNEMQVPNIVNPVLYRVLQQPSGLTSDWKLLPRSVVSLPSLGHVDCDEVGKKLLIHGSQLDQIDWASTDMKLSIGKSETSGVGLAKLTRCDDGLCLEVKELGDGGHLKVKVHWIDDRAFYVKFPEVPRCSWMPGVN